jgi:uncharacterized Zn-finger protein
MRVVETINTTDTSVSCSGKETPFDHPTIYLKIDKAKGSILCSYCGKKFILTSEI